MASYKELLAHYDNETPDKEQYLIDHLLEVSNLSKETGGQVGLGKVAALIGLLHDLGKSNEKFQRYICGEFSGRVNHSSSGAKALDYIEKKVMLDYGIDLLLKDIGAKERSWTTYKEILQYPILAHHGLYDVINQQSMYHTKTRLDYDDDNQYNFKEQDLKFLDFLNENYSMLNNQSVYDLYYEGFLEFFKIEQKMKDLARMPNGKINKKSYYYYYSALIRLLLSVLKDADIYDSSNYYRQEQDKRFSEKETTKIWGQMQGRVESLYKRFEENPNPSELNKIRTSLANEICTFSKENNAGAYKLSMPVGSGKTYAALRYAVNNARTFNKSRIFYCTAFLSVLEQNAKEIREVLGDEHVLEHHSNIMEDYEQDGDLEDQKEYLANEYLKESWESPVVLTTLVQLFNTLFKDRASNIRRFSRLINGVIIIDEIQSLPNKAIYNANLMMNFLTHIMNCNIVHCTATQPNLGGKRELDYPCIYGDSGKKQSIVGTDYNSNVFNRVEYHNLLGENFNLKLGTDEIISHIIGQLEIEDSILIVLNTKGAVARLYNELTDNDRAQELGVNVVYLTTNQCPKHRLDIIEDIKEKTKDLRNRKGNQKIICVSTKLIESGVDIDFDIVYRSLAGVDSIIQCGGRCNREGKKASKGKLFIINYDKEQLGSLRELKAQQNAAETALRFLAKEPINHSNLDIEKASNHYFSKLFLNAKEEEGLLEYPVYNKGTIFRLLSTNPDGIANYSRENQVKPNFIIGQGFKTAAINFNLIDEKSISVITRYKNEGLINDLYEAIESYNYPKIKILLQRLQQYTVSIRRIEGYERYISKELEGDVLILNKDAYDEEIGLTQGELQALIL